MNLKADIEQKLEAAKKLHQAGQLPDAQSAYGDILNLDPDNADAYRLLGMMALHNGNHGQALELVDKAIAAQADSAIAHNTHGAILQEMGKPDEAVESFRRAVDLEPGLSDAHYNLGLAQHTQGRLDAAAAAYRRAIEADESNVDAHFNLGGVLKQQRKYLGAIEEYRQVIQLNPENAMSHSNLGSVFNALDRHPEALEAFDEAIRIEPGLTVAHFNRGNALAALSRSGDAIKAYQRAIETNPKFSKAHTNLAQVFMAEDRHEEAVAALEMAVEAEPKEVHHRHVLAVCLLKDGNPAAALDVCRAGYDINPENGRILSLLAALKEETGDEAGAGTLLDLERFIRVVEVKTPPGYAGMVEFNGALTEHVCSHPTLISDPSKHATRHGQHTGELLAEPKGPMAELEDIIMREGLAYRDSMPADPTHPFFRRSPERPGLTAWGVVMGVGGHQVPHIHPTAWLSGVYYPRVPDVVKEEDGGHEGWIEFGLHDHQDLFTFSPRLKFIRPQEGMMLLFPSYFFHRTIPFKAKGLRVSIAFDLNVEP